MIEPTLALQTAIRAKLIATPAVIALVTADHITAGNVRPENMPAIIISDGATQLHGHDYKAQRAAWVYLDLHVWTIDQGTSAAKEIVFAVQTALNKTLSVTDGYVDSFKVTRTTFPRDPDPKFGHGVLSVEALIRWLV